MSDIQPYRPQPDLLAPSGSGSSDPFAQTIDIPGAGLKRDYAGLLEYWQMVRRHKAAVVLLIFVGGLVGFLTTLSSPRVYQAHTSLEIQALNQEFLNLNMKNVNPVSDGSGYIDADIQTQVKIIQSRGIIDGVVDKIKKEATPADLQPPDRLSVWKKTLKLNPPSNEQIWNQAISTAAGSVRVRGSDTNRIVDVSCDSTIPQLASDFCNTLTKEYIDQNLEARWKTTEYTGEWLSKQLQDMKVKLEKQEEELQSYARATSLVITGDGDHKTDVNETRLGDLQKELSLAQADRFAKQSKYEMASSSPSGALPDVLDDVTLKDTQKAVADLQAKKAQLGITYTPNHAEVKKVQAQIDALQASVEGARANVLTRIRNDFEAAQKREALLTKAYQEQASLVSGKAEETAHFNLLKRDVDATRLLYETLQQRLKEASIASALRANNVRVVDAALKPGAPYKPDVRNQILMGLLFGAVLGVAFSVLRERADRTLQDPGDIGYYLNVPELGVVPVGDIADVMRPRGLVGAGAAALQSESEQAALAPQKLELISWNQKSSLLAESFRTTLTSILFSAKNGDRPRVIVLTSASPKEGKTTVVSNLGIAMAEINRRVLVIDADMRRPRLHRVFDMPNDHGLSDLLMENRPLTEDMLWKVCVPSKVPGMFILPSGGSRRNVSSLLHSDRLTELLQLARTAFDAVIVDTPPMVNIADARVIARQADGLIMVVRSGVTTRDAALLAKSRFAEDGTPLLGTILNGWNPKTPGYSYYRYYYAGYYHYYGDGSGKNGGADDGEGGGAAGGHDEERPKLGSKAWAAPRFAFGPQFREGSASADVKS